MNRKLRANLLLILTAMIWGAAFVAQDVAGDVMEAFSFNASRSAVAAAALLPLVWFTNRKASNGQGSGMAWNKIKFFRAVRENTLLSQSATGVPCRIVNTSPKIR